jgi:hypothetical protein
MLRNISKIIVIILLFCSCQFSSQTDSQVKKDSTTTTAYVFVKVYPTAAEDTAYIDSTVLDFSVDQHAQVSGTYRWVIPGKDGKFGNITGHISDDTVYGHYHYQQEGGNYDDSVQIILQQQSAVVIQFNAPGYRLTDTLTKK